MMKTGLLVISNPNIIFRALPIIQKEITNTIYIQYFPVAQWTKSLAFRNVGRASVTKNTPHWPTYSSSIIGLYSKFLPNKKLDVTVLLTGIRSENLRKVVTKKTVEVVYYDQLFSKEDVQDYVGSCVQNKTPNCEVIAIPNQSEELVEDSNGCNEVAQEAIYDNVVLGGTFDRLHYGHKILLSEAILRCRKKITVGVTDIEMLKSKKLWELIEPCDLRISNVRNFLEEVEPTLEYDIVAINDMFGPTKDDPTFQMIVVSSETVGGGGKVNEIRAANGLDPLCIHKVELLEDINKEYEEEENKISSSNLRMRCLGTLLKTPQPNPNIPTEPYIIGLTGGIGSGKTKISGYLEELGAGVVNCDQVGHQVYSRGTPGYQQVVEHFGPDIILDKDGAIDRKKLGSIVFQDKEKLAELNAIVWPLIISESLARARQLCAEGRRVVVLEAAVLITAQWTQMCHEIWVSVIPPKEAVKRVMERNRLAEEEAQARVAAQPSNTEQVGHAHLVFSTLWSPAYTQQQVQKAWTGLQGRLPQS